jgi:hypothetical protein
MEVHELNYDSHLLLVKMFQGNNTRFDFSASTNNHLINIIHYYLIYILHPLQTTCQH